MTNLNPSYINLREDLLKHINGSELEILDVGCATGENGRYLLQEGFAKKVVGVEYDEAMASIARDKLSFVYDSSIEDKMLLSELSKNTFDFILLGDVLEHLYDPETVLRELTKTLKSNGKV